MEWFLILAGFILLLLGGESLVKGAVAMAKKMQLPPLVIGIVLVGFGTSIPELVTCITAALQGSSNLAFGNVVGSNTANILLVAGTGALMVPIMTPLAEFKRDGSFVAISTVLLVAAALFLGSVGFMLGAAFVALLLGYIAYMYLAEKRKYQATGSADILEELEEIQTFLNRPITLPIATMLTVAGIATTILGAKLLVMGAIALAEKAGVSETVIGLTIVAIGTSLPELATAIIAGLRNHSDLSLGNILGSNIYNILGVLGVTAMVSPMPVPSEIMTFDLWVMVLATLVLTLFALTRMKISRLEGGLMLSGYFIYLYLLYLSTLPTAA